jgi:hypothetical protein
MILDAIPEAAQRPAARFHVRAARRAAEQAAKQLAAGLCSSAHHHLIEAHRHLARGEIAGASTSDTAVVSADVAAVERSFDRCVVPRPGR